MENGLWCEQQLVFERDLKALIRKKCSEQPNEILIERLRVEMGKVINAPDVVARFEKGGGRILRMSPGEADAYTKAEISKWSTLIRQAGIKAD